MRGIQLLESLLPLSSRSESSSKSGQTWITRLDRGGADIYSLDLETRWGVHVMPWGARTAAGKLVD